MSQVHEFTVLSFNDGVEAGEQVATMGELDADLAGCAGLLSRECFRGVDGRWVEHVVWSSRADLEAAADLDEDPAIAALFDRIDADTVTYACGERVGSGVERVGG